VRVGRPALDEDAIRTIEDQHPEIEFDWPHILEVGASSPPEVERRPLRQRRKPPRPVESAAPPDAAAERDEAAGAGDDVETLEAVEAGDADTSDEDGDEERAAAPPAHDLLEQLVGREIATRLRGRYAEIVARIHQRVPDPAAREMWEARAAALDPDAWVTADEILSGVSRADELLDAIRRELLS
jgi:hypothetical protein